MAEYKINMILDSGSYKLSYSKGGKQNKVTIGNEKNITVMAARKISSEVEGLLNSELKLEHMEKCMRLIQMQLNAAIQKVF